MLGMFLGYSVVCFVIVLIGYVILVTDAAITN